MTWRGGMGGEFVGPNSASTYPKTADQIVQIVERENGVGAASGGNACSPSTATTAIIVILRIAVRRFSGGSGGSGSSQPRHLVVPLSLYPNRIAPAVHATPQPHGKGNACFPSTAITVITVITEILRIAVRRFSGGSGGSAARQPRPMVAPFRPRAPPAFCIDPDTASHLPLGNHQSEIRTNSCIRTCSLRTQRPSPMAGAMRAFPPLPPLGQRPICLSANHHSPGDNLSRGLTNSCEGMRIRLLNKL